MSEYAADDVARIRFAFAPLFELVMSLIVLRVPGSRWQHPPWVRATQPPSCGTWFAGAGG